MLNLTLHYLEVVKFKRICAGVFIKMFESVKHSKGHLNENSLHFKWCPPVWVKKVWLCDIITRISRSWYILPLHVMKSCCRFSDSTKYIQRSKALFYFIFFILLDLPTRAGSPQQHKPITVGPFYLTHPVNFRCGRKPEYPGKTHDFGRALTFYSFHMRTGFESHWEST
jgi:hypothetical protein